MELGRREIYFPFPKTQTITRLFSPRFPRNVTRQTTFHKSQILPPSYSSISEYLSAVSSLWLSTKVVTGEGMKLKCRYDYRRTKESPCNAPTRHTLHSFNSQLFRQSAQALPQVHYFKSCNLPRFDLVDDVNKR